MLFSMVTENQSEGLLSSTLQKEQQQKQKLKER